MVNQSEQKIKIENKTKQNKTRQLNDEGNKGWLNNYKLTRRHPEAPCPKYILCVLYIYINLHIYVLAYGILHFIYFMQ